MGAPIQANVSDAGLGVLRALWLRGPAMVHKQWAHTTILALLSQPRGVKRAARRKEILINQ